MKKRTFKQILLIATFCIALVAVLIKIDWVIYALGIILKYLSPLFIGFCIAFVLNKPYMFFRRSYAKIFKKDMASKPAIAISLTLSYIIFLGVIALFFWLLIPSITESVTTIAVNYEQYWEQIQKILTNVGNFFHIEKPLPDIALEYLEKFLAPYMSEGGNIGQGLANWFVSIVPNIFSATVSVATTVAYLFFGFCTSVYLLASRDSLLRQSKGLCYAYLKKKNADRVCNTADICAETFGGFISGRLIDSAIIGVVTFIGLTIFGFSDAILISVIICLTNIIPIIGPFIGGIPSALLILISPDGGFQSAIFFAIFILAVQQLDGNLIAPKIVGNSTGLPAVWTLIAVIVGGGCFGIIGALLAVPTTAVVYKLLKNGSSERLDRKHIKLSRIVTADGASVVECPVSDDTAETSIIKDDTTETDIRKVLEHIGSKGGDDKK